MSDDKILREQLVALLGASNAHAGFDAMVAHFPLEAMNRRAPNLTYTPWRLLEHIRIAQWDILEFVRNPQYVSPPWPAGYWPAEDARADQAAWNKTLDGFHRDLADLQALARDPANDLTAPLPHAPGPEYTLLREILVAADHNAYHIGELGVLKTLLGVGD
ncbi:MAG TPA: DinB family protein [Anaerolineales bacterium]